MIRHSVGNFNPHDRLGRFTSGKQYSDIELSKNTYASKFGYVDKDSNIEYATQQELDEARRDMNVERNKQEGEKRNQEDKRVELQKEIDKWNKICEDPHSSPYLREKALKELPKLKKKLDKLK